MIEDFTMSQTATNQTIYRVPNKPSLQRPPIPCFNKSYQVNRQKELPKGYPHSLFQYWNTFPWKRPILKLELQHFQIVWMAILKLHKTPTPNTPIRRQPFFFFFWPFGCHYILFLRPCLDKCHGSRQINLVCVASLSFYLFLYLHIPSINPSTNP